MTDSTLQVQSKKQRLVELGRAIFNRQSGSNTISARSQRLFRATKAKSIWKNGLGKARKHWSNVRKHKRRTQRESTFDSMYPVGNISWPIPQEEPDLSYQAESNRNSVAISVTVTTPTPSNSQRDQGKRQTVWIVRNGDAEPSPVFPGPLRPRPGSVSIAHPQAAVVGEAPSTPTTTRSSNNSDPTSSAGSEDWSSKPEPRSKWSLSDVSSGKPSPETETFPGQVNPIEIAEKRKSQDERRLSHDILDGHCRSDRDQLPSQLGNGGGEPDVPSKRASAPTKTPSVLKPGKTRNRPTTMHFGAVLSPVPESAFSSPDRDNFKPGPEIPPIALPGTTMEGVRDSMYDIAGHPREATPSGGPAEALNALEGTRSSKNATRRSTVRFGGSELSPVLETAFSSPDRDGFGEVPELPHIPYRGSMGDLTDRLSGISGNFDETTRLAANCETLDALEGKTPVDREPSQITHWEVDSAMNADHAKYPGKQIHRHSTYEPFQKGKIQKPQPVPIATKLHSRPSTPITPPRSSRGKQPAVAKVEENLARAREEVNKKHRTLSKIFDQGYLVTPPASVSGRGSSVAEGSEHPSGVDYTFLDPETPPLRQETPTPAPRPPPQIARKPVARQPSQKRPDTDKPLPNPPAQHPAANSPSRLTLLESRITALETQLSTRPRPAAAAAAAASAAASLHSAIHTSSNVPRGPHRARASRKRDVHHEQRQPAKQQPSLGSVFRDVVVLGKSTWGRF